MPLTSGFAPCPATPATPARAPFALRPHGGRFSLLCRPHQAGPRRWTFRSFRPASPWRFGGCAPRWLTSTSTVNLPAPPPGSRIRVPIAALARPGHNEIELELVGTLRNLLGPHHLAGGDPSRTNPEQFRDKTRWTDDYLLTPFGWEQVRLCW